MSEASSPRLLSPVKLRDIALRNRIVVAPMCTYSATDGLASDFHLVHLGRFALGGAGLVMMEATAVQERGRITHGDLGLWHDGQIEGLRRIAEFLKSHGAAAGIQLAHAGRKASMQRPWHGNAALDEADYARGDLPWEIVSPGDEPFNEGWLVPKTLTLEDIEQLKGDFLLAAHRAIEAGFDVLELHCAHGYLLHSFLSPLVNQRNDDYGGDRDRRMRLPLEIAGMLREAWPSERPIFVRISSVDGKQGGWSLEDSVAFAGELRRLNIDVVDCSSGGVSASPTASAVPREYGFQVPFAEAVRKRAGIASMAVGLIVDPHQAERILASGQADLVAVARQMLENPNWALHAELALRAQASPSTRYAAWPEQYGWWLQRRAKSIDRLGPWQD